MLPNEIRDFEKHLANCPRCAEIVARVRANLPISLIHQTEDGPVHLWATRDPEGGLKARFWGVQLAGMRRFATLGEANLYLQESFSQMFPRHVCGDRCICLDETEQERAAARMQFWDYSG